MKHQIAQHVDIGTLTTKPTVTGLHWLEQHIKRKQKKKQQVHVDGTISRN